jgi:hypothetical protein
LHVSEENIASIFGVEEYVKQPTRHGQQAELRLLLVYSVILKMEAVFSCETLVNFY